MANAPGCLTRSKGLVGSSECKHPLPPGEGLTHEGQDTMWTTCLVLLFSWLAAGALGVRHTDAAVPHALVMDLATPAKQREALMQLRDLPDPALGGVLQALKEGALYLWQEETLLILNDAGTLIDLDNKPLLDSAGQPLMPTERLEQVELAQAHMPLVQRALEALELLASEPAKRKA